MAKLYNLARMTVSGTPGTGTITLLAAVAGHLTFANAGVANADVVAYAIEDGTSSEVGIGTYSTTGPTLTRDTVTNSTAGGTTKISATSAAQVYITARKEDIANLGEINTFTNKMQFPSGGGIYDDSGNEQLLFSKTASAVNYVTLDNAATGEGPMLSVGGDDTDIALKLKPKQAGGLQFIEGIDGNLVGDYGETHSTWSFYDPNNNNGKVAYFESSNANEARIELKCTNGTGRIWSLASEGPNIIDGAFHISDVDGGKTLVQADPNTQIALFTDYAIRLTSGTTDRAPLFFQSGTLQGDVNGGEMEWDGNQLFFTPADNDRRVVPTVAWIRQHATYTLSSTTGSQKIFNGTTNGALTLPTGVYEFEALVAIASMSGTSGNAAFLIDVGSATVTNGLLTWTAVDAAATASGGVTFQSGYALNTTTPATNMATAATATAMAFNVKGTFEVSGAGTIIPSIKLTTAATAIVQIGSYFKCWRMGGTTDTSFGAWS